MNIKRMAVFLKAKRLAFDFIIIIKKTLLCHKI